MSHLDDIGLEHLWSKIVLKIGEYTYSKAQIDEMIENIGGKQPPSGIRVKTPPTKTVFDIGDTLDLTGLIVEAYYPGGKTAVVSYTASPANGTVLTTQISSVTLSWTDTESSTTFTVEQAITVNKAYVTYSALLDLSKTDPEQIVTYADDASGVSKGWDNWKNKDIFSELYNGTCVLKDGEVLYYLDPDDLTKKADGTAADITTLGNDVMLEIPRLGYSIEWQDANNLKVSVTNDPNKTGFTYDAFSLDSNNDCDKLYIGVYKGYTDNTKLYSSSGKTKSANKKISDFRTLAMAKGDGYQQRTFGSVKLMQCLYLISHGTLDTQSSVGIGYVNSTTAGATGTTNNNGFDNEIIAAQNPTALTNDQASVKCLGLEDFWGGVSEWVDGLVSGTGREILTSETASSFNDSGTGYFNNGNGGVTANIHDFMIYPQGESKTGFVVKTVGGSSSTYFCDYGALHNSCVAYYGGTYNNTNYAGGFMLAMDAPSTHMGATIGARLCYMHKESRTLDRILVSQPTKKKYPQGRNLKLNGAVVTAVYTSGLTMDVTDQSVFYPENGSVLNTLGSQTITATYTEDGIVKTATTTVEVIESLTDATWSTSNPEEIAEALEMHYSGLIDIRDYWDVGDERTVLLNAMSSTALNESITSKEVTFVLANVGGKKLVDGVTDCAFVVQQKSTLGLSGVMNTSQNNSGGWVDCERRTWCNNTYRDAIPSTLRNIFKLHINKAYVENRGGYVVNTMESTEDYFALPAEVEITGQIESSVSAGEGERFEYFKNNSIVATSWCRSVGVLYGYFVRSVAGRNDVTTYQKANTAGHIAPFGVI